MVDLETIFIKFKEHTITLINCLEADNFDALEGLMNDRQALIDQMKNDVFDKELFKRLYEYYDIEKLDLKMNDIMYQKMDDIKSELRKVEVNKNVNNNYYSNVPVDSIFFNKKI